MDRVPKKYWTGMPAGPRLTTAAKGASSDAGDRVLKIDVTGVQGRLSETLRGKAVRRVLLALSRFGPRVRKVTVCLSEPVNPLGGVDQRCRMRVWLRGSDGIRAEAIDGAFELAVARAAAQIAKRVDSALGGDARHAVAPPPGARRRGTLGPRGRTHSR